MKALNRRTLRWVVVLVAVLLIGALSAWSILSHKANQDKSYTGAKFILKEIECTIGTS